MSTAEERNTVLMIKGAISELNEEDQKRVYQLAEQLRNIIDSSPTLGHITLALIGAEYVVKEG